MQDLEFTIEENKLWILQTRTGKRNGPAAIKIALDMYKDKIYNNCKLFGPKTNTRVAAKYFKKLLYRYNGSIDKAIAAYNRGHAERSKKTGKFVNQRYVDQVKSYLPQYQALTREAVLNT